MNIIVFGVTLLFVGIINAEQNTYRAAVLEYAPVTDGTTNLENWQDNLKEIIHFIRDAANQKAQIIVLPEIAIGGLVFGTDDLETFSTEIPDPNQHILPCTVFHTNNFTSTLRDLSCAAQTYKIYVVVNLIEKVVNAGDQKHIYYNTNVVFNRNGELIVRYRKINLFNQPLHGSGNELATFTTDFGVTFGVFICFDILFKRPADEIFLNSNVTDIVYSTAWYSHLPFHHSLSVHHGYAKSNGINFLAAGLNIPSTATGGSGIYLADGRITETFISGTPLSKLIIQDVPKISARTPNSSCKLQKTSGSYEWGVDPITGNISEFHTFADDMTNYTFKPLNLLEKSEIVETICGGFGTFCCTFNISTTRTHNVEPTYTYMLAAFQGTFKIYDNHTLGRRDCGIVACLNDNTASCGKRKVVPPRGITFEKISLKASLDNRDARYMPTTVTFDLKPATDYTYCAITNGNMVDITMTSTDSHDTLLTFGLGGRVFNYDRLPVGSIKNATVVPRSTVVLVLLGIVSVLLYTTTYL